MSIFIGDRLMSSERSATRATRTRAGWAVSWIPCRYLDRNQAVTAMVMAEAIACGAAPGSKLWLAVQNWLAELNLCEADLAALPHLPGGDRS